MPWSRRPEPGHVGFMGVEGDQAMLFVELVSRSRRWHESNIVFLLFCRPASESETPGTVRSRRSRDAEGRTLPAVGPGRERGHQPGGAGVRHEQGTFRSSLEPPSVCNGLGIPLIDYIDS